MRFQQKTRDSGVDFRRIWVRSLGRVLFAVCLFSGLMGGVLAINPDPASDLLVEGNFNRPGCDVDEVQIEVKNSSQSYDYRVEITGTTRNYNGPAVCCVLCIDPCVDEENDECACDSQGDPEEPCCPDQGEPEWLQLPTCGKALSDPGETYDVEAGECVSRLGVFDNCVGYPDECDCDNDVPCDEDYWCAWVDNLEVVAVSYRDTGQTPPDTWKSLDPSITVCDGMMV